MSAWNETSKTLCEVVVSYLHVSSLVKRKTVEPSSHCYIKDNQSVLCLSMISEPVSDNKNDLCRVFEVIVEVIV